MKLVATMLGALAVCAVVLGIWWLLWALWCWVMPQNWLFVGMSVLISVVGKAIFGGEE